MLSFPWLRRLRRPLLAGVLLALVAAQTLGAIHRIVHATLPNGEFAFVSAKGTPHGLAALFAGHSGEQGCEVYDQLAHADLLPALPPALPPAVPEPAPGAVVHIGCVAQPIAASLARGPPVGA
jgi:hypothetical protein